jgi:hypothetical protein
MGHHRIIEKGSSHERCDPFCLVRFKFYYVHGNAPILKRDRREYSFDNNVRHRTDEFFVRTFSAFAVISFTRVLTMGSGQSIGHPAQICVDVQYHIFRKHTHLILNNLCNSAASIVAERPIREPR